MRKTTRLVMAALGVIALLAISAPRSARADSTSFNLSTGNSALSGFGSPYVSVTINRTSTTTATVTFTSLTSGGNIYLMGDGSSVALNVNATSFTVGTITGTNAGTGFTPGTFTNSGAGNVDGFGSLNLTITDFDGFSHAADNISFTITNTSGTWGNVSAVLVANNSTNNAEAAAHVFVTSSPANASNGALATGFAANAGAVITPEPTSMLLFGVGALILGIAVRRRERSVLAA